MHRSAPYVVIFLSLAGLVWLPGCTDTNPAPDASPEPALDAQALPAETAPVEAIASEVTEPAAAAAKPNVLWIVVDSMRPDHLGAYGYDRPISPAMDEFAASGVVFENAYAQGPCTWLSVQSYMTGRHFPADHVGYGGWRSQTRIPPPDEILFADTMEENGYRTASFSANPFCHPTYRVGASFDKAKLLRDPEKSYAEAPQMNEEILTWIEANAKAAAPFFVYVHTMDAHTPHYRHEGFEMWRDPDFANRAAPTPPYSPQDIEWLTDEYDASLRYADHYVGELLTALDELGLRDDTIIIIGADHAEVLGEDGHTYGHPPDHTSDTLLHVPLIVAGPGVQPGVRVTEAVENADIIPTLIDWLGLSSRASVDGQSLAGFLKAGDHQLDREYVFSRATYAHRSIDREPMSVLRGDAFKYVYNPIDGIEELYRVPDAVESRESLDLAEHGDTLEHMRSLRETDLDPLWQQYAALPRSKPENFQEPITRITTLGSFEPEDALVNRPDVPGYKEISENKWTVTTRYLISGNGNDAPPLTCRLEVPNGRFRVEFRLLAGVVDGRDASALRVKAMDDAEFKLLQPTAEQIAAAGRKGTAFQRIELGTYDVSDDWFVFTVDEADPEMWSILVSVHFFPIDEEPEVEDVDERQDQLRSLGYL